MPPDSLETHCISQISRVALHNVDISSGFARSGHQDASHQTETGTKSYRTR